MSKSLEGSFERIYKIDPMSTSYNYVVEQDFITHTYLNNLWKEPQPKVINRERRHNYPIVFCS